MTNLGIWANNQQPTTNNKSLAVTKVTAKKEPTS